MKPIARRGVLSAAGALAALQPTGLLANPARITNWPQRTVTIVVPHAPGGGTDIFVRSISEGMRRYLGQTVVVENRPGANGVIGTAQVGRAEPDGYLLVAQTGAHVINRYSMANVPFHPVNDFASVALLSRFPLVLAASGRSGFRSLAQVVEAARARPGQVTFGTTEAATSYVGNYIARRGGVTMNEVPYRGSGPQMNDLVAGHIDLAVTSTVSVLSFMGSGAVRAIGMTSAERVETMPDVPTIAEGGFPGFEFTGHYGLYAPKGTDIAIRERLYAAIQSALQDPETRRRLMALGVDLSPVGPVEFGEFLKREDERWAGAQRDGLITVTQ